MHFGIDNRGENGHTLHHDINSYNSLLALVITELYHYTIVSAKPLFWSRDYRLVTILPDSITTKELTSRFTKELTNLECKNSRSGSPRRATCGSEVRTNSVPKVYFTLVSV